MKMHNLEFGKIVHASGVAVKHAVEVGAHSVRYCNLGRYLLDPDVRVELFEPQPDMASRLVHDTAGMNVEVHAVAICKTAGTCVLMQYGVGAHVKGVVAPAVANRNLPSMVRKFGGKQIGEIQVPCRTFDDYDDGTIDIITLDTEGAEWWAIERMQSRPAWICIEMGDEKNPYKNPFTAEINQWMRGNNYVSYGVVLQDHVWRRSGV